MKNILFYIAGLCMWLLTSCTTQNMFTKATALATDSLAMADTAYQYVIQKDDKISLSVWGHDDLSVGSLYGIYNSNEVYGKWLLVDANGEIPVPKLGNIRVSGLTLVQAEKQLQQAFGQWIVNPIVELKVLNKEVTIMGELKTPGKYLLEKDKNTLLEMISRAGDFDFYANKKNIMVLRKVKGVQKVIPVNLVGEQAYAYAGMNIYPGDVIYVPSRKGKHWDKRAGSTIVPIASVISSIVLVVGILK
jgi:polysaccharide biosynthesis/export protein